MTHEHGVHAEPIHMFAWDVFQHTTALAERLGLYGAGKDLLSDAFWGNLRGMGPGYAELEFEPRPSQTVLCFLADTTEPGAWNVPVYKMHAGFSFEVHDLFGNRRKSCARSAGRRSPMKPPPASTDELTVLRQRPGRFRGESRVVVSARGGHRARGLWFAGRPALGLRPWAYLDTAEPDALPAIAQALGDATPPDRRRAGQALALIGLPVESTTRHELPA